MKEMNTAILKLKRHEGGGRTDADPGGVSRTKAWQLLCDAVVLLLAFLSMSVLTVVTIVFMVTTMAHTQEAPATEPLYGDLAPHYRQSGSRIDYWPYTDMYTLGPAYPASMQDEYSMYVQYQDIEPDVSW